MSPGRFNFKRCDTKRLNDSKILFSDIKIDKYTVLVSKSFKP